MNQPAPKKSLGQHFLVNQGVCAKIARLLRLSPEDQILEIGPGPGALTKFLLAAPHSRLLLIEKDDYWASARLAAGGSDILAMDALKFDWQSLCADGFWKLAGNLPYNIASPLIWDIVSLCRCWLLAAFMTQKEVAERICAKPGSRQYGALSVWIQSFAFAKLEFIVKPNSFRPPPKVDSAVILLAPLAELPEYPQKLKELLAICFQKRRKQLAGIFRAANQPELLAGLEALGIAGNLRPENLSRSDYLALARYWANV